MKTRTLLAAALFSIALLIMMPLTVVVNQQSADAFQLSRVHRSITDKALWFLEPLRLEDIMDRLAL